MKQIICEKNVNQSEPQLPNPQVIILIIISNRVLKNDSVQKRFCTEKFEIFLISNSIGLYLLFEMRARI